MYEIAYTITCFFHLIALYYAILTIINGEHLFCNSSPLKFFSSNIERQFWIVVMGAFGNFCALIVKPVYILEYNGNSTGWQEPLWVSFHISMGFASLIWHYSALENIRGRREGINR